MPYPISIRIPKDLQNSIRKESRRLGIPITEVICNHLSDWEQLSREKNFLKKIEDYLKMAATGKNEKGHEDLKPHVLEILFLLRELVIEKNSQILRRAQIQLDTILGEDRPKIGT